MFDKSSVTPIIQSFKLNFTGWSVLCIFLKNYARVIHFQNRGITSVFTTFFVLHL